MEPSNLSNEELIRQLKKLEEENQKLRNSIRLSRFSFDQIFANIKQIVLISDHNTGSILYANSEACQFYDYSPEEFSQLSIKALCDNNTPQQANDELTIHRKKDGTTVEVMVTTSEFSMGENVYRLMVVSDLKSHTSNFSEQFREIFSIYNDLLVGFFSFNNHYVIQSCNRSLSQITGYKESELIGMNFLSLIQSNHHQQVLNNFLEFNGARLEAEGVHKNGKIYPIMMQFSSGGNHESQLSYAAFRDITEMKKTEEKLTFTNDTFVGIFNTLTEAIYILDKNSRFVDVNGGAIRMYGYSKSELVGKTPVDVSAPGYNNLNYVSSAMQRVLETGISEQFEFWGRRKNGEIFPKDVILNKGKYFGEDCIVATARDITERKMLEKNLQAAKEAAEESERLKTAFLQNMSHEIRTPLNAIIGFAQMLEMVHLNDQKRKEFLPIIETSANQLLDIVGDILSASSLETGQERIHYESFCVNNVLSDLLTSFNSKARSKNISMSLKQGLSDEQSTIKTDKTKIIQILSKLLSNAIKFTHQGFIEFGYRLNQSDSGEWQLIFYVEDSGIGISHEWQQKIFDRFRQVENREFRKYGGNGLGLSIAKGFVELLGGKIWVESKLGKGSTFFFTIPYFPSEPKILTSDNGSLDTNNPNNPLILLAEDEEINMIYIKELLNICGYHIIHAKDGKEAIDLALNTHDLMLVLMDIKMPEVDGYTAAKIIKEKRPHLPIIAQTAYALEHEKKRYSGIFDEYLTKPLSPGILKETVEKFIKPKEG